MTDQELEYFKTWYKDAKLSGRIFKTTMTNGQGVLVWGKVVIYPATVEQWIREDCKIETPDNYLKPVK